MKEVKNNIYSAGESNSYNGLTELNFRNAEETLKKKFTINSAKNILAGKQYLISNQLVKSATVFFLRSYTLEPLSPLLEALSLAYKLNLDIKFCPFNSYVNLIFDS